MTLVSTIDPIPAFGALARQATETSCWPQDQAARIAELFARAVKSKQALAKANWPRLYGEALVCAKESLADLERQQHELAQESISADVHGNAEAKSIEASLEEADSATKMLKIEIDKAARHYVMTNGRLDRQAKQILEAIAEVEKEFAVSEDRSQSALDLRVDSAFQAKVVAFMQAALDQWSLQTLADLPRYVPGETPHLMRQLDSDAKLANVYPFSFDVPAADPPSSSFTLDAVRGHVAIPGLGGQFYRTFRSAIYGVSILIAPIVAVAGLFAVSGGKMNMAERGLIFAAFFSLMGVAAFFWARNQRDHALAEQIEKERGQMRDAYRRTIPEAVARRREMLGNQVKKYCNDAARNFGVWSDDFMKRVRERREKGSMEALEKSGARQEEINQKLNRVRMAVKQLQESLIPKFEERVRDLSG